MKNFRFVILGAGNIAEKFVDAVSHISDCEVAAVGSRSAERAAAFANKLGIEKSFGNYEEMLDVIRPDAAYIATTHNTHAQLIKLCIGKNIPVLCEKTMCMNAKEAEDVFAFAKEKNTFLMEAMWSRFLPAVLKAKEWIAAGKIGKPVMAQLQIGNRYQFDADNRFFSKELGGGAALDLGVYGYQITTFLVGENVTDINAQARYSHTGVDTTDHISMRAGDCLIDITATIETKIDENLIVYGEKGKITLPHSQWADECIFESIDGTKEIFSDTVTKNGFVGEIKEAMKCVREGKKESDVVPSSLTINCSKVLDMITQK